MKEFRKTTSAIQLSRFGQLLDALAGEGTVFVAVADNSENGRSGFRYRQRISGEQFILPSVRACHPLKQFLFSGRKKVSEYPAAEGKVFDITDKPLYIVGAAACDIAALQSLDVIFLQDEFTDIFYKSRRESTVVIGMDCTAPLDTCFCTLAGGDPYPREGFDLSLSPSEDNLLVETGSDVGDDIIARNKSMFRDATDLQILERDRIRSDIRQQVSSRNSEFVIERSRTELLEIMRESDGWFEHVATCVGCGACLFACPTCHCFLLYDQRGENSRFERIREWDACIYAGFSRMAGGSSPRLGIMERFRHRYLHKLEYYPKNFGFEACTGCGRCIAGCMGQIDMRAVLKDLDTLQRRVQKL